MNKGIVKSTIIKCVAAVLCCAIVAAGGSSIADRVCSCNLEVAEKNVGNSVGSINKTFSDSVDSEEIPAGETVQDSGETVAADSSAEPVESGETAYDNSDASSSQQQVKSVSVQSESKPSASSGVPSSIQDIVYLYNKSVNRVKPEAKKLTRVYHHVNIPQETIELPSAIQGLGKSAIKQFVKNNDEPQSWTSRDDIKTIFPVGGTDYSSKLTPDMVKSATCKDNGSSYSLRIILYNDKITKPAKGQGYAGVFNTISASTFEDINIPTVTFEKVKINGINGNIACTIDKTSGRVTVIIFTNTDIMDLSVKVGFSNLNAKMNLAAEDKFKIEY